MLSLPTCDLFLKLLIVIFLMLHVVSQTYLLRRKCVSFTGDMARPTTKQELIYASLF